MSFGDQFFVCHASPDVFRIEPFYFGPAEIFVQPPDVFVQLRPGHDSNDALPFQVALDEFEEFQPSSALPVVRMDEENVGEGVEIILVVQVRRNHADVVADQFPWVPRRLLNVRISRRDDVQNALVSEVLILLDIHGKFDLVLVQCNLFPMLLQEFLRFLESGIEWLDRVDDALCSGFKSKHLAPPQLSNTTGSRSG